MRRAWLLLVVQSALLRGALLPPAPSSLTPEGAATTLGRSSSILLDAERGHAAELSSQTAAAFLGNSDETSATHVGAVPPVGTRVVPVGALYAGPDRVALGEGSENVHISTRAVLTLAECLSLRLEARVAMALGFASDFAYTDLARIGEVHVADLPIARRLLRYKLDDTLLPLAAECFALKKSSLRVRDAVVIRYDAAQQATRQVRCATISPPPKRGDSSCSVLITHPILLLPLAHSQCIATTR